MGRSIQYVAELRSVLVLGGRRRDVNPMLVHDVSTRYSQAYTALYRLTQPYITLYRLTQSYIVLYSLTQPYIQL